MNKIRSFLSTMKKGVLKGENDAIGNAILILTIIFTYTLPIVFIVLAVITLVLDNLILAYIFAAIAIITILPLYNQKLFTMVIRLNVEIFFSTFGKNGNVVSKIDWKNIRKSEPHMYKWICSKESIGYCYSVSRSISLFLDDAELMYCSIKLDDGSLTAHSAIVKNDTVYDTNCRRHFEYNSYLETFNVTIYKTFPAEVYRKESFFDDIRADFVAWCEEHQVYCDPQ